MARLYSVPLDLMLASDAMAARLSKRERSRYNTFCRLVRASPTPVLHDWLQAHESEPSQEALIAAMVFYVRRYLRCRSDAPVKRSRARARWHGKHPLQGPAA